jgi:hypothetical protein
MKRITLILLFGCLISNIYTRDSCYYLGEDTEGKDIDPEKKEDCTDYKLTDREKIYGDSCCYVVSKKKNNEKESKSCEVYNKKYITKEYIDEYIKEKNEEKEENYKLESYSIECRSNWISFSFIFAFLVFLF